MVEYEEKQVQQQRFEIFLLKKPSFLLFSQLNLNAENTMITAASN